MRPLGMILVIAGILALIYGGFSYTRERTALKIGSLEAKVDEKHHVPLPPIVGAAALLAGIALIASEKRTA